MPQEPEQSVRLGIVDIELPTVSEGRCYVFMDLAAAFGLEFNADAANKLSEEWRDGSFGYGQVLSREDHGATSGGPTLVLFDY